MKRKLLLFWFITALVSYGYSQNADTLIYATGKITSAETKEAIEARISYQSLPYGSVVGMLSGSSYRIPLFNERYSITVEAAGYAPSKYMLDPAEAGEDRILLRDIELGLPSSALDVAHETHTEGKVLVLKELIFEQGRAKIGANSYAELDKVVTMINQNPNMVIQLEGHTDTRGNPKANLKLSQSRVEAVKDYLVSKKIPKSKVKTKAFGGTAPISKEDTEEAHRLNRRVELRILKN
ncbi:MAG: OmpA family protein [Cyclobacteriaceae bacterium]|jgi:outer membrane protein OmpA-like peptidoglycan-associated protein